MGSLALVNITRLWPLWNLSVHVWSGRSPDIENVKYVVVCAGPSLLPQLSCYSLLGVSVTGNEPPVTLPWRGGWGGGRNDLQRSTEQPFPLSTDPHFRDEMSNKIVNRWIKCDTFIWSKTTPRWKELLIYETTWINLKNIMLRERCPYKRLNPYYFIYRKL